MSSLHARLRIALHCCILFVLALAARADTWIVDATGAGDFVDLPQAVAAASDGDTLLVRKGIYSGFSLSGKGLAIVRQSATGAVTVGTVRLHNISAPRVVLLSGLRIVGLSWTSPDKRNGLELLNVSAPVRVQDCVLRGVNAGGYSAGNPPPGAFGATVQNCADVVFARCHVEGGRGSFSSNEFGNGGPGGTGLAANASILGLFDSTVVGGEGASGGDYGGLGGTGLSMVGGSVATVGGQIRGGRGGGTDGWFAGANGGVGLLVTAQASAYVRDTALLGGPPSPNGGSAGAPYVIHPGCTFTESQDPARKLLGEPQVWEGGTLALRVVGEPGDLVWLPMAKSTRYRYSSPLQGPWTLAGLFAVPVAPVGVVGASGELDVQRKLPSLAPGESARLRHVQLLVTDALGVTTCGTALAIEIVACDKSGDCNANGVPDACDIAAGTSLDANFDGVPDECP